MSEATVTMSSSVPGWLRKAPLIGLERGRSRTTAYVYGNILVLASVLAAYPDQIRSGQSLVVLGVTMGTTYLAHVLAHGIGERIGRSPESHRVYLRHELRDAVPIASSGFFPGLALVAGALGWLSPETSQLIAAGLVVLRLGGLGWVVQRFSPGPASRLSWVSGLALAAAGALIAGLKVVLLH